MTLYATVPRRGHDAPHAPAALISPAGAVRIAGGTFERSGAAPDVVAVGDDAVVAWGRPRFATTELAAIALRDGAAAAWHAAFARHAGRAPAQARGRWAVLVVQRQPQRVWFATDRFATWPLCHAVAADGTLHVADRADALPGRALSAAAVFAYLYHHCIPAPLTVFDGVQRLPAAHVACWQDGTLRIERHWAPAFDAVRRDDIDAAKAEFLDLVTRSVERDADGADTGAFLSGGTDSSTVSGLLCRSLGRPADTYSIGFDASGYDEMAYAELAARHFGTRHHKYYVTPDDLLHGIPQVAVHYDQPFGNSSAVPAWICARRARDDGRERLLAGDGGDELFGGNARYAKQRVFEWYGHVPEWLRRGVVEPVLATPLARTLPLGRKGASYVEQARVPLPRRTEMYNLLRRLGVHDVLTDAFVARVDPDAPVREQEAVWDAVGARSVLNRMLALDWKYTLADNDLPKVVGTTQLAGVDVAFPLLADELVDFSLMLPDDWKLKGGTLRWFFKEALRDVLPAEIIAKKKHGFGLPFGVWACAHAPLNAMARDALGSMAGRGIVRPDFVRALFDIHLPAHPGYYGEMVWILMTLEFWLRTHAPDATFAD